MRTAREHIEEYRRQGHSDARIRVLAHRLPTALREEVLRQLDDAAVLAQGEIPAGVEGFLVGAEKPESVFCVIFEPFSDAELPRMATESESETGDATSTDATADAEAADDVPAPIPEPTESLIPEIAKIPATTASESPLIEEADETPSVSGSGEAERAETDAAPSATMTVEAPCAEAGETDNPPSVTLSAEATGAEMDEAPSASVSEEVARGSLRLAAHKLPVKTKFIRRETEKSGGEEQ